MSDRRTTARSMREQGHTLAEIGAALGVSSERARQLLLPLEPRKPRPVRAWPAEQDALLGVLPDSEVATRLSLTVAAVRRCRLQLGIARPLGRPRKSDVAAWPPRPRQAKPPRPLDPFKQTNYCSLVGASFGRLKVMADSGRRASNGQVIWACVCECGGSALAMSGNLKSGNTTSCGCHQIERSREANTRRHPCLNPPLPTTP